MVKNLPANAGDTCLILGPGGFHMVQGNYTRASRAPSSATRETTGSTEKRSLCSPHLEKSPRGVNEDPMHPKISRFFLREVNTYLLKNLKLSFALLPLFNRLTDFPYRRGVT